MNFNSVLAVLEIKGILTHEEADRLTDHLDNKPQSTRYEESLSTVREVLAPPAPPAPLGNVGPEQQAEEQAARTLATTPEPPANETPTEFPTLPGANESAGNDLSYSEVSDNAKEQAKTGNTPIPSESANGSSDTTKSTTSNGAVKKTTKK